MTGRERRAHLASTSKTQDENARAGTVNNTDIT